MPIQYLSFPNSQALAEAAAQRFVTAIPDGRDFLVALSGGRIAKTFYDAIVATGHTHWRGVHFFFCDERCVPPTDPECNFATARQYLFEPLQIPNDQIHRLRAEADETFALQEAEAELCRLATLDPSGQPILDLAILGMGEDGHTASLFPGEPASLIESPAVFRAVTAVKPPPRRLTIGYAPLKVARQLWVLASGQGKAEPLKKLFALEPQPISTVVRSNPNTLIFSDVAGVQPPLKNL